MYQLSPTLQAAIAAGNPQRALIEFFKKPDGTAYSPVRQFSNEDILITNGVKLTEEFNSETDLTIGLCPSAQIQFDMLNDAGQLADFEFGTFRAYLGARVSGDMPPVTRTLTPSDFTLEESGHVMMAESAVVAGGDPAKAVDVANQAWSVYALDLGGNADISINALVKNNEPQGVIPVAIHSDSGYTYYAVDADRIGQQFTGDKILINKMDSVGFVLNSLTITYLVNSSETTQSLTPNSFQLEKSGRVMVAESAVVSGGDPAKAVEQVNAGWSVYSYDFGRNARIRIDAITKNNNVQGVIPAAIHSDAGYEYYSVDSDRIGVEFTGDKILINRANSEGYAIVSMTITYTLGPPAGSKIKTFTEDGETVTYEFAPLGTFIAKRPDIVKKKIISVDANDQMTLFDEDMLKLTVTYPITLANLAQAICSHAGVSLKTNSWLNSAIIVSKEPKQFESSTMREVIGWIAEAAGCNARFNRDGLLEFFWFNSTNRVYDETDYADFTPTWYATHAIDGLHIRNADSTEEYIVGDGDNAYMIQDNPFLRQDDSTYYELKRYTPDMFRLEKQGYVLQAESQVVAGGNPEKAVEVQNPAWSIWSCYLGGDVQFSLEWILKNPSIEGVIPAAVHSNSGYTYYSLDTDRVWQYFNGDKLMLNKLDSVGFAASSVSIAIVRYR